MGRHSKPPARRNTNTLIALTGLVPAGVVAVSAAATSEANTGEFTALSAPQQQHMAGDSETAAAAARLSAAAADGQLSADDAVMHVARHAGPPVVRSNTLPENRVAATAVAGPLGMPGVAYAAYQNAERVLAQDDPNCHMSWAQLAGIGQIESHHGYGKLDENGYPINPVYGPVLDGSLGGNQVVNETDGGELDGMAGYARAVGPMQFLPSTYRKFAADGKGDGTSDPQNIFDASLTAGKYLCDGGLDMNDPAQQSRAIMRYNHSMAYVANVMAWETAYREGVTPGQANRNM
ncbi:lytic transglycosylase domain-containing protein [Nocardia sp. alder85J]|uniref:lytic transglycosylase domain-containing protein n=1 Tax=Nocardia sp. alder85J TaxID=2862949 RepID=UPI001CD72FAB|nr:lytic murein transglycosylase [Nocardia sp. alder85J]MCX4096027.1 lytic murein transglycosylase [Nocardia sp. alder85J]